MAGPDPRLRSYRAGRRAGSRIKRRRRRRTVAVGLALLMVAAAACVGGQGDNRDDAASKRTTTAPPRSSNSTSTSTTKGGGGGPDPATEDLSAPVAARPGEFVNPASSGHPWSAEVSGLLTFRGNPTRSFYGADIPVDPSVQWSYPGRSGGMCGDSSVNGESKAWCGTGWTGEPAVWKGPDGRRWVAFGAYDKAIHVVDGETGEDIKTPFGLGDIIKGSVTVDPDGFPLLYSGSRDSFFHIFALDRGDHLVELYKLSAKAVSPTKWNNDWDGSALIIDDYLFEGGENSQLHILKLNRQMNANGKITVDPELVFHAPGWDDELLADLAPGGTPNDVSIENSVALSGNTLYFANSGGLVQGWDLSTLKAGGEPKRVFRFWTGDDTDASIVIDGEGFLYVASEYERGLARARDVGQLMKLDPRQPDDPLVWSVKSTGDMGIWATPAISRGMVYVATNGGRLLGVDADTGEIKWEKKLPNPTWQSAVVVDDVLVQGDCNGVLHGYDVSEPGVKPKQLWSVKLGGCIESTPAVWDGWIYVATRAGRFWAMATEAG